MADTTARGAIEIKLEDQGITAVLKFEPDPAGPEQTEESIRSLLNEKGIRHGLDTNALSKAVASIVSTGNLPSPVVIARGTPAIPGKPADFEWAELPVPPELEYDLSRTLEHAPAPEVYTVRIDKVKRSRKVLKKSKIPFSQPKEVIEEYMDKVERREQAYVNPEVIASGWCEAGMLLGRKIQGTPGKPGKDVCGQPVPAAEGDEPFFYGSGVQESPQGCEAAETGFLRRGSNWVEVLPFLQHQWDVSLSEDHNTCFLSFNPGAQGLVPPAAADIVTRAEELGYPADKLMATNDIQGIIAAAVKNDEVIDKASISVDEDGWFNVHTSEDKLKAFLSMRKKRGTGKPLVLKEVGSSILNAGLKTLDKAVVQKAILDFYRSPAAELKDFLLCEGKAPTAGENDEFELQVTYMPAADCEAISARIGELKELYGFSLESWEKFGISDVQKMALVKKDQLIGQILKGKAGEPGSDVFGTRIDPAAGKEAGILTFEGLKVERGMIAADIDGVLEYAEIDGKVHLRLHPHRSASISIRLSEDRMKAFLSVSAPEGSGFTVSEEQIREEIKKAGVVQGLAEERIADASAKAAAGEAVSDELVAEGTAPRDAGSVEIDMKVAFATGQGVSISKDGHADYRRQDRITMVVEGDLIAEVTVPQGGSEPGLDVTGKTLSARELKQIPLSAGANVETRDGEGVTRYYARVSGALTNENNVLEIKDAHYVAGDVDMKTGNVKFNGAVSVKGSVLPGFVVFSGGDIQVGGIVDGALLSAEGSISIANGVKGAGKAVLRSKQDIFAGFIEQAHVMAVRDITVKNSCLRSNLRCNGKLRLVTEKGNLTGGSLKTRRGADVQNLGHANGVPTKVFFGQDYLIADRIQVEEKEIAKTRENVTRIDMMLHRLEAAGEKTKLARARQEKLKFIKLIEKRSLRLFTLREKFEEHYPSEIIIRGTLYPGVVFESHGRYYEVDSAQKGIVVYFDPDTGRIQHKPVEKTDKNAREKKE